MKSDLANFYGTAAQVIPALILILVIETGFLAAVLKYRGLWESGTGGLIAIRLIGKLKQGRVFLPIGLPERVAIRIFASIIDAFFLRPTRRTNSVLVLLTVLLAITAEGLAFVGLAFDVPGKARTAFVVVLLAALGVLLFQVLLSLVMAAFSVLATSGSPKAGPGS
ncbi:hypothetical protein [Micromonospora tulbaghiae]|uniref:hypothetical protein n=1 Tax=Micromonospora tulbaghiae TaxID=479978 RepID=UPI003424E8EB